MSDFALSDPSLAALTAVGSGRKLAQIEPSRPLLFICFGQETQAGIESVESVAREAYPLASELLIAHVIDLHKIPGLLRKIAEGVLAGEHKKAVEALSAGQAPDDYVVMLPDWDGAAVAALGLDDATKVIGLALAGGDSAAWRYQGEDPAGALRARLAVRPL